MSEVYHIPALLEETLEGLNISPEGVYVDVTLGGGGHSRAILERLTKGQTPRGLSKVKGQRSKVKGHLYSFDQDIDAFREAETWLSQEQGAGSSGHWCTAISGT